jgi:hypothetical protein
MQLSKLDLRTLEAALKGGEKGAAIIPGKSSESRLYRRVAGLEKPAMPMDATLTGEQISAIKNWIDQGAHWDAGVDARPQPVDPSALAALENMEIPPEARNYWAFKLPVQAPLPNVLPGLNNPIDRFLEKTRQDKGLKAAPQAGRLTLLRRAYLDLIGLPPSPAEAAAFLSDKAPDAWERLIDKLLASPHYGERWGRHWLDVARYADSDGFEHDYDRPNAWMYRDYVVRSFNEDKPYNLFIEEQIAGDEFGRGIVATLDNFGKMGDPPTHPELLDWLTVEFMNRGWRIKQLHKLIMTSNAYQMASAFVDNANLEKDMQNQYLWRYRTQRLDAEVVRDSILVASGAINLAAGGKAVRPPLPETLVKSTIYNVWRNQEDGPET